MSPPFKKSDWLLRCMYISLFCSKPQHLPCFLKWTTFNFWTSLVKIMIIPFIVLVTESDVSQNLNSWWDGEFDDCWCTAGHDTCRNTRSPLVSSPSNLCCSLLPVCYDGCGRNGRTGYPRITDTTESFCGPISEKNPGEEIRWHCSFLLKSLGNMVQLWERPLKPDKIGSTIWHIES